MSNFIKLFCTYRFNALFFLIICTASPARGEYVLVGGPAIVSGEKRGVGGFAGLISQPEMVSGFWPGIFVGRFNREKIVSHLDLVAAVRLGFVDFCLGGGVRLGELKLPAGQITYGLGFGPTTIAMRRYQGTQGLVTEGVITINVPLVRM